MSGWCRRPCPGSGSPGLLVDMCCEGQRMRIHAATLSLRLRSAACGVWFVWATAAAEANDAESKFQASQSPQGPFQASQEARLHWHHAEDLWPLRHGSPPLGHQEKQSCHEHGLGHRQSRRQYIALKMNNYAHKDPALTPPLNCIADFFQALGASGQRMMLQSV